MVLVKDFRLVLGRCERVEIGERRGLGFEISAMAVPHGWIHERTDCSEALTQ